MPSLLSTKDWEIVSKLNCNTCPDKDMCDQVKYDCPKIDFKNKTIDESE